VNQAVLARGIAREPVMRGQSINIFCVGLFLLRLAKAGVMPAALAAVSLVLSACATISSPSSATQSDSCAAGVMKAEVVALEQAYVLNRFGAYVPAGMLYALKSDVVAISGDKPGPGNAKLRSDKRPRPLVLRAHEGGCLEVTLHNWLNPLYEEEGGQPHEPSILLTNGQRVPAAPEHMMAVDTNTEQDRKLKALSKTDKEAPRTRHASLFITGLESVPIAEKDCRLEAVCGGDGSYVGLPTQQGTVVNPDTSAARKADYKTGSLIPPGGISVIRWIARREGTYFAHSMGAPVGGEGDGGQIGLGLFAAVNVEPANSTWYRSQLSHSEMQGALKPAAEKDHPYVGLDYAATQQSKPVLALVKNNEIVHSDLNAIIVRDEKQRADCTKKLEGTMVDGQRCEPAFREFTVILHDEVHAQQAFPELEDEDNPLHYLKDGMGINYGVSSMGSLVIAAGPQKGVGPAKNCPECRAEEFFLSSWANGDPALILKWDDKGEKPIGARYPDDPSNVHHSYLGDPVVFRNLHAGPKETHVFHLHAHQWVLDASDPNSTYLDSQTISPGATFSYGIEFGGSGNRNFTPGDSIFHCHLYPHFAQGMWELWRVHDVFENGLHLGQFDSSKPVSNANNPQSRSLPDAEVKGGTANPALVPLPGLALAPMSSAAFRGYPFYIPGEPGHRPPQPVLDMDVTTASYNNGAAYASEPATADIVNGGLPRHVIKGGTLKALNRLKPNTPEYKQVLEAAISKGGEAAQVIAQKVYSDFPLAFQSLAADWDKLEIKPLNHSGEPDEQKAMQFHEGLLEQKGAITLAQGRLEPIDVVKQPQENWWTHSKGYLTSYAPTLPGMKAPESASALFHVNGRGRAPGSPYANPCPQDAPTRNYKSAFIQTEITVNKHGWFDPQGRIVILEEDIKDVIDVNTRTKMPEPLFFRANSGDCINFKSSNFIPSALNADDFQIYTPTDTIGQHIHLVKFDVTSSDGSGNGWNYEDTTFSPDEVRERVMAHNRAFPANPFKLKVHPLFQATGSIQQSNTTGQFTDLLNKGQCPERKPGMSDHEYLHFLSKEHPYCGAQRTTQRWWADPILVRSGPKANKDNTLRTVFTHDHMGPSSHQQHGLYAALVIEPANSVWRANPSDAQADVNVACVATDLRALAVAQSITLKPPVASGSIDDAVYVSFALRASPTSSAASRERAEACLKVALLGGSDLSKPTVVLTGAGDEHLKLIKPRPVWQSRADGGPTSTRATIISPTCIDEPDSSPVLAGEVKACASNREANQTRREFGLAFADFAGVYNIALEPINPETPRDVSMRRFGERQVVTRAARPIAISSEDPGTQLVNYRHEPLALRLADVKWNKTIGGFDYSQTKRRATNDTDCRFDVVKAASSSTSTASDLNSDCLGDMANGFSSYVHSKRDRDLATQSYFDWVKNQSTDKPSNLTDFTSLALRQLRPDTDSDWKKRLGNVLEQVEEWRQDFNCALYAPSQWLQGSAGSSTTTTTPFPTSRDASRPASASNDSVFDAFCQQHNTRMKKRATLVQEPWRVFGDPATPILATREGDPVQIRLIQGAQEAQHVFTMNGVKWHRLPDSPNSGFVNAQPLGISEHFEFDIRVPKLNAQHADYLYFGSSVDQLWDGMWGVMRAYKTGVMDPRVAAALATKQIVMSAPDKWLPNVPGALATSSGVNDGTDGSTAVCLQGRQVADVISVKSFDVSAVEACALTRSCGQPGKKGLSYSDRYGFSDPHALVYVLNKEESCEKTAQELMNNKQGCSKLMDINDGQSNQQVLTALQAQFANDRKIEPLVLRAAAGQCITVKLRNHLPGPVDMGSATQAESPVLVRSAPPEEKDAYYNFLPMIADGFNLNQIQMSRTVGISAPRVAQNPLAADGSNTGLNSTALLAIKPEGSQHKPGSLVRPCSPSQQASAKATNEDCSIDYVWSATDLKREGNVVQNLPVEFGALPLRSFGDAIKHPMHGLVGALIIGPVNSRLCGDDARHYPGGTSRQVCTPDGKRYGDHVLVMQDAVSATQGGFPIPDLRGAEEPDDYGVKAINYKTEPLWARRGGSPAIEFGDRNVSFDYTTVFSSKKMGNECEAGMKPNGDGDKACDPETPVMQAKAGDPIRLHFVHPGGHTRQQGLTISGHGFHPYPWTKDSTELNTQRCWPEPGQPTPTGCMLWQGVFNGFGPMMGQTFSLRAGGAGRLAKDYLVRTQASFLLDGGLWGILRVTPDK
jgi:manganese oxidase